MASTSDGLAATLSSIPDLSLNPLASPSERKFHLQLLLDNKEKQLQQAGALGQRVLAQQIELEEKIRHLQDFDVERGDDEDLDTDARERYRELADTIKAWDLENAQLSSAFGQQVHISSFIRIGNIQVIARVCASFRASWLPRTMTTCRSRALERHATLRAHPTIHRRDDVSIPWRTFTKLSFSPCFRPLFFLPCAFACC